MLIEAKADCLKTLLSGFGKVLVAFSGGTDSTLLLAVALRVLGPDRVLAVIADSPSLARKELEQAIVLARSLGTDPLVIRTTELQDEDYRRNGPDRCFFCKKELFQKMETIRRERGFDYLLYGANYDDARDFRPGMQAAAQAGASAPLLQAGLSKAEVRALAREMELPNWNKPAAPCLASRIPYGTPVSAEKLSQVEKAEDWLRTELGWAAFRVRHHENLARIEAPQSDWDRFRDPDIRARAARIFREIGFEYVSLDLENFRSGRMHEVLIHPAKEYS